MPGGDRIALDGGLLGEKGVHVADEGALDPQAVAVILNLVEPIRGAGDLDAAVG